MASSNNKNDALKFDANEVINCNEIFKEIEDIELLDSSNISADKDVWNISRPEGDEPNPTLLKVSLPKFTTDMALQEKVSIDIEPYLNQTNGEPDKVKPEGPEKVGQTEKQDQEHITSTMTQHPETEPDNLDQLENVSLMSFQSSSLQSNADLQLTKEEIEIVEIDNLKELQRLRKLVDKQKQDQELLQLQLIDQKLKVKQLVTNDEKFKQLIVDYEKDLFRFLTDNEINKQRLIDQAQKAMLQRDLSIQNIIRIENEYKNLYEKYEKCKVAIYQLKKNEDILKVNNVNLRVLINEKDEDYCALREHAKAQLDKANTDRQSLIKDHIMRIETLLEKQTNGVNSMQNLYEQKVDDCDKLMDMCGMLVAKFEKVHYT